MKHNAVYPKLSLIPLTSILILSLFICDNITGQSVSTSKSVYSAKEEIIVNFSGFLGTPKDWISIATKNMGEDKYLVWVYTPGTRSGSVKFNPMAYGEYEIRGYYDNGAVVKARTTFTVGNPEGVTARTVKSVYKPNEKINVIFTGLPGHEKDWISLAKTDMAESVYALWQYTNGKQAGEIEFTGYLAEGNYEVRTYFNNENVIKSRHPFRVSNTTSVPSQFCRTPLSVFFAGLTGIGAAWARTTCEPFNMSAIGVRDIQASLGNTRDGLNALSDCYNFNLQELNNLIARIPSLSNIQAEAEIEAMILKLQEPIIQSPASCTNGASMHSLFVTAVHLGAAQAHASCQICGPAPMPMAFQTVIRNHLNTARDAFANYLPCVPGVSLTQFDSVPLNSINSLEAHTHIVGLHTNLLWNISLSTCCCDCK